jgi:hypothetical protein
MKFLYKSSDSLILKEGITYLKNNSDHNKLLKEELLKEQKGFCAYTEKYVQHLDSAEVEHFNPYLKYKDNYYNYYAVIRKSNQYKNNNPNPNLEFFKTRFFQKKEEFTSRITFKEGFYFPVNDTDTEAIKLIEYLNLNHPDLYQQRSKHVNRLAEVFEMANYTKDQCIQYFKKHIEELSFITAIEDKFGLKMDFIIE